MDKYIKYDAQPGVVLYIENKGSNKECCYDLDIKDDVTELYLMVFDFCLDDNKKQFKNVSKIVILDTCGDLCLPNQMFPNVKEVVSCNSRRYFVKRNKLLFDELHLTQCVESLNAKSMLLTAHISQNSHLRMVSRWLNALLLL